MESFYSNIRDGKIIGMLALDIRESFYTVNHKIILEKLQHYGISGISLKYGSLHTPRTEPRWLASTALSQTPPCRNWCPTW